MNVTKLVETYGCNISIFFILMATTRNGQKEDDDPRNANFCPHLEVDRANAGVQASTHKNVVDEIAGHANLITSCDGVEIHPEGDCETVDHRD